ncbi:uncharacterized protein LOC131362284 isoform X2 [Hemibagrus wyckioides]|uniref:uncharacterized protein LOC131362284 isoform X2 n=1 Tax=Hemibagrus wyckioides TaxID=337641 RepID=UPI00266C4772|nr:uncharacterized protein LOC131362284 isoform X2 [Hemibagrus wyckioides]
MAHRGRGESYVWTDNEVKLFLNVTTEYKNTKTQENVDWESCQSKYADVLALFLEQYPQGKNTDFPHRKEDITRAIITSKLKVIRGKYRQAVDSGRKSSHGRVVLLYFEAKLKAHKQDRLKRKLPAETQLLYAVEEDIQMKKRILDMMETSERHASENFRKLSTSLESQLQMDFHY